MDAFLHLENDLCHVFFVLDSSVKDDDSLKVSGSVYGLIVYATVCVEYGV